MRKLFLVLTLILFSYTPVWGAAIDHTAAELEAILDVIDARVVTSAGVGDASKMIKLDSAGKLDSTFVNDFALEEDADAGDKNITSVDRLEGVDTNTYIDIGDDSAVLYTDDHWSVYGNYITFPGCYPVFSNGATGPGKSQYLEDSDNGTSAVNLAAPSSLASSITVTLPGSAGTLMLTDAEITALAATSSTADKLPYFDGASSATTCSFPQSARNLLAVSATANKLPYYTSSTSVGTATISSFGRTQIDDADAAAGRATLGYSNSAWKMVYSDTNGDPVDIGFSTTNKVLASNGASAAPAFESIVDAMLPTGIDPDKIGAADGNSNNKVEADYLNIQSIDITLSTGCGLIGSAFSVAESVTFSGAFTMTASGVAKAYVPTVTDNNGFNMSTTQGYGYHIYASGAGTIRAPDCAAGMEYSIDNYTNGDVKLYPHTGEYFILDGVAKAQNLNLIGSDTGDCIACTYYADNTWYCDSVGYSGSGE